MLQGAADWPRDVAMIECVDDPGGLRLKTIVSANRKLTWYCGQPYGEMYDMANDPQEKTNHWDDPAYASDKSQLLARLRNETDPLNAARRESYMPDRVFNWA